jgi:hypothetical protein
MINLERKNIGAGAGGAETAGCAAWYIAPDIEKTQHKYIQPVVLQQYQVRHREFWDQTAAQTSLYPCIGRQYRPWPDIEENVDIGWARSVLFGI